MRLSCRPLGWESIPRHLKRFTNSGSWVLLGEHSWGGGRLTEGNSWGGGRLSEGNSWGIGQPLREQGAVYEEINIFKLKLHKRFVLAGLNNRVFYKQSIES